MKPLLAMKKTGQKKTAQPFKKGVLSPLMFAHVAVLDPRVTVKLPPHLTAATGMDAFIHALEAYTGKRTNPLSDLLALESMRLTFASLEAATVDGSDLEQSLETTDQFHVARRQESGTHNRSGLERHRRGRGGRASAAPLPRG